MKAARLHKGERRLRVEEIATPEPGPGEVRIRVRACGVCGSDVHATVHPIMTLKEYPRTMGHESSGEVHAVGSAVKSLRVGQRVVVGAGTSCGSCKHCLSGRDNACERVGVLGFDREGAFAEYIVVPERYVHVLPDSIPFDQGAILADAVSTPYHAIRKVGRLEQSETLVVFGCGGLGLHAVLLGRALGAGRVIAVDVDAGALENAGRAGATELVDARATRSVGKTLKELTGGVDLAVDFSGHYGNVAEAMRCMNTLGRIVLVGLGRGRLELALPSVLTYRQLCVCGSYGCERSAVPELIELLRTGRLDLTKSITSHHPLEEVNDCLENLYHRNGNPIRFVITP